MGIGMVGTDSRNRKAKVSTIRCLCWILIVVIILRISGMISSPWREPQHTETFDASRTKTSVFVDDLPGAFLGNTFFLLGARLTSSYQSQNHATQDVHVDLFASPGDFVHEGSRWGRKLTICPKDPMDLKSTALHFDEVEKDTRLYCRVHRSNTVDNDARDTPRDDFSEPIPMILIPFISGDGNQDKNVLVWRCNITESLSHEILVERAKEFMEDDERSGVQVQFLARFYGEVAARFPVLKQDNNITTNNSTSKDMSLLAAQDLRKIATIAIPLDTGVVGNGGPQVIQPFRKEEGNEERDERQAEGSLSSSKYSSYFLQPDRPFPAGLCTATYGEVTVDYMEEFVQHHVNVGFHQVYMGIRGNATSRAFLQARRRLQDYIDQGVLVLGYYGMPHEMDCNPEIDKMQFYQMCLYHFKGLTKYCAVWDLDEFWLPPENLVTDGRFNADVYRYDIQLDVKAENPTPPESMTRINASDWSSFARPVREDPLWQESVYANSVSFADTVVAIDNYYKEHGCDNLWCFHMFPARITRLRNVTAQRVKRLGRDFEQRDTIDFNVHGHKGVVNTEKAHMAGLHWAGACRFQPIDPHIPHMDQKQFYHPYSSSSECSTLRFDFEIFGSMHHFYDMLKYRTHWAFVTDNKTWVPDEYVSHLSGTVNQQLDRRNVSDGDVSGEAIARRRLASFRQTVQRQLHDRRRRR